MVASGAGGESKATNMAGFEDEQAEGGGLSQVIVLWIYYDNSIILHIDSSSILVMCSGAAKPTRRYAIPSEAGSLSYRQIAN